jgi:type II secretory pathway component PulL
MHDVYRKVREQGRGEENMAKMNTIIKSNHLEQQQQEQQQQQRATHTYTPRNERGGDVKYSFRCSHS